MSPGVMMMMKQQAFAYMLSEMDKRKTDIYKCVFYTLSHVALGNIAFNIRANKAY